MQLFISDTPIVWGKIDLPLLGISSDWYGAALVPPLAFSLACDSENLWFIATRQARALALPHSGPGTFTPELWKSDTAELFIAHPSTGEYIELNLAPNGAWWAAKFSSARVVSETQPDFENHITTYHENVDTVSWLAAMCIPLEFLETHVRFGSGSTANPAFILNSPEQTFHSGTRLPGKEPDFHQPSHFKKIIPCKLPAS